MSEFKATLTEAHLATFEWYVKEWACHFGVDLRWQIRCIWSHDPESARRYAAVTYNCDSRMAVVELTNAYSDVVPLTDHILADSACHEVIHILLGPLADYAEAGAPRGVGVIGIEHEIVQTLVQIAMRDHFDSIRARCPVKV